MSRIRGSGFEISFHGVRGSTPCHGDDVARYGGNTSCVSLDVPGHDPVVFDLGTGARYFGLAHSDAPFRGHCLVTHLHWDHVQGLPFFPPLLQPGSHLDLHAPVQEDGRELGEVLRATIRPPLFPVELEVFPGDVTFHAHGDDAFSIGDEIDVVSRLIPHIGNTLGYRVSYRDASVAYLSDHQQPGVDVYAATDGAFELCRDVDVLIHDAQFTRDEFAVKSDWGHCTIEYAVWLAIEARASTLVLFHHDPTHDDDRIDELLESVRPQSQAAGLRVVAAYEGLQLHAGS